MSWAKFHIEKLLKGQTVSFRPSGNSMKGRIENRQLCTVSPLLPDMQLKINDIVLCKVKGKHYLHLLKSIDGERFLIGNNKGGINGWCNIDSIFGKCIDITD